MQNLTFLGIELFLCKHAIILELRQPSQKIIKSSHHPVAGKAAAGANGTGSGVVRR